MAAPNTEAIYSRVGDIGIANAISDSSTAADITAGANLLYTADATNGSWIKEVRVKISVGTSCTATVCRLWINNGSTTGTASNSVLFSEISIPTTTASNVAAFPDFVFNCALALPPSYKLYATQGTDPGAGSINYIVVAGKY